MEHKHEEMNNMVQGQEHKLLEIASESLLANLPILILGLVIFLAAIMEFLI